MTYKPASASTRGNCYERQRAAARNVTRGKALLKLPNYPNRTIIEAVARRYLNEHQQ